MITSVIQSLRSKSEKDVELPVVLTDLPTDHGHAYEVGWSRQIGKWFRQIVLSCCRPSMRELNLVSGHNHLVDGAVSAQEYCLEDGYSFEFLINYFEERAARG